MNNPLKISSRRENLQKKRFLERLWKQYDYILQSKTIIWENSITERRVFHSENFSSLSHWFFNALPHFQRCVKQFFVRGKSSFSQTTRNNQWRNTWILSFALSLLRSRKTTPKKNIFTNKSKLKRCIRLRWERIFPRYHFHSKDAHWKDIVCFGLYVNKKYFSEKKRKKCKKAF